MTIVHYSTVFCFDCYNLTCKNLFSPHNGTADINQYGLVLMWFNQERLTVLSNLLPSEEKHSLTLWHPLGFGDFRKKIA